MYKYSEDKVDMIKKKRKVGWRAGRQFPNEWASGPDLFLHALWRKFLVARNQARYWGQDWTLTWEEFCALFKGIGLDQLGNGRDCKNIARIDWQKGWESGNVELASREDLFSRPKMPRGMRNKQRMEMLARKAKKNA
jgi:hypothetical protein